MEIKDLTEYLGIDLAEDATIDTFKESFSSQFVRKDRAADDEEIQKAIFGKQTREFATEVKRAAKESGIELSEEEAKLPVKDLVRLLPTKKDEFYTGQIEKLKEGSKKPSEAVQEWEQKYKQLETKFKDVDNLRADLASKYEAKEQEFVTFKRDFKKNEVVKDVWSKANTFISDTASELERTGFQSYINQNYTIDLEDDKPVILKDGHRIPDPNKAGEFLDPITAIRMEAEKNKILKVTNPEKVKPQSTPAPNFTPEGTRTTGRRVVRHN
jgi:hypothetical protein